MAHVKVRIVYYVGLGGVDQATKHTRIMGNIVLTTTT